MDSDKVKKLMDDMFAVSDRQSRWQDLQEAYEGTGEEAAFFWRDDSFRWNPGWLIGEGYSMNYTIPKDPNMLLNDPELVNLTEPVVANLSER